MWLEKVQDNVYTVHCTVCRRTFSVAYDGLFDRKQHTSSGGHIGNMRDNRRTLYRFVVHKATPVCKKIRMFVLTLWQARAHMRPKLSSSPCPFYLVLKSALCVCVCY